MYQKLADRTDMPTEQLYSTANMVGDNNGLVSELPCQKKFLQLGMCLSSARPRCNTQLST